MGKIPEKKERCSSGTSEELLRTPELPKCCVMSPFLISSISISSSMWKTQRTAACVDFGWDRVNFLPGSSCGSVLGMCAVRSFIIAEKHSIKAISFSLNTPPAAGLGGQKELWGDRARTADPRVSHIRALSCSAYKDGTRRRKVGCCCLFS